MSSGTMRWIAASSLVLAVAACGESGTGPEFPLPQTISVCERHNEEVCSTWTRSNTGYVATFDQGTVADVVVTRFNADSIVAERTDRPGPAPHTTATYRGARTGNEVRNGIVTFRQSGQVFSGHWRAQW